jgi:hypothetical protein
MLKVAVLIWVVLGTTLAGTLVLVVLMMPSLQSQAMKFVALAGIGGYIISLPLSWIVAGRLMASMKR